MVCMVVSGASSHIHGALLALALTLGGLNAVNAQSPPALRDGDSAQWLEVSAQTLTLHDGGWQAEGQVVISPQDDPTLWRLEARRAELQGHIIALDEATLTMTGRRVEARTMRFDLFKGRITGTRLTGATSSDQWSGVALRLSGEHFALEGDVLVLIKARVMFGEDQSADALTWSTPLAHIHGVNWLSATPSPRPPSLKGQDTTLSIGGAPVWCQPSLETRLDGRQLGLLPPTLGWRGGEGALIEVSGYAPLGSRADTALSLGGASGGLLTGGLTLRLAQADQFGRDQVGGLKLQGRLDDPGVVLTGRGAVDVKLLPPLRYDATLISDRATAESLRAPLTTRLGATNRSAVVLGPRALASALDVSAALWQPLAGAGPIWRDGTHAAGLLEGVYDLRGALAGVLSADLRASYMRLSPLSATGEAPVEANAARQAGQAMMLEGSTSAPWTWGRFARLTVHAGMRLRADVFDVTSDTPSTAAATRLASSQQALGVLEARLDSHVRGRLFGRSHSLRPTALVIGAPIRRRFGDEAVNSPTASLEAEAGRLAVFGGLAQRLALGDGRSLRLDLGVLGLRGVRASAPDLPDEVLRVGGRVGLQRGAWGWRAVLEMDPGVGAPGLVRQAQAVLSYGAAAGRRQGWRGGFTVGVSHRASGAALTTPAWRAPWMTPTLRAGPERSLTGARGSFRVPLGKHSPVWLGGWGLWPLAGRGTTPGDGEWSAQVGLGRLIQGLELRVEVTRRAAPETFDAMLTASLLTLP